MLSLRLNNCRLTRNMGCHTWFKETITLAEVNKHVEETLERELAGHIGFCRVVTERGQKIEDENHHLFLLQIRAAVAWRKGKLSTKTLLTRLGFTLAMGGKEYTLDTHPSQYAPKNLLLIRPFCTPSNWGTFRAYCYDEIWDNEDTAIRRIRELAERTKANGGNPRECSGIEFYKTQRAAEMEVKRFFKKFPHGIITTG